MSDRPLSFYFFDFDDNIMFLQTEISIINTETQETMYVSTGEFANIHPLLGQPGQWSDYAMYDGSFRNFRDLTPEEKAAGQPEHFVADIEKALQEDPSKWQAPSWRFFVHACNTQRPLSIVTARGHSRETLRAGVRVLKDHGLIEREPHYHSVYPVGNDEIRRDDLDDPKLQATTPVLKRRAILKSVDKAVEAYDRDDLHFGMSDDDPANVNLIIKAMNACKRKYLDKRFYVINTHFGEMVKLEVLPFDG